MTRFEPIAVVVFDAYGTLFDVYGVAAECERLFPRLGEKLSQVWRAKQLEYSWLRSIMDQYVDFGAVTESALVYACRALGVALEPDARRTLMAAYLRLPPYPDALAALGALAAVPRVILSNGTPFMLHEMVRHAGLARSFDAVLSVDEVGVYKPSSRVYALVTTRFGVRPEEVAFVSSNRWDIAGAASFGFRAFWVNRSGGADDELPGAPEAEARALGEIAQRIAPLLKAS